MDFSTKPINGSPSSLGRINVTRAATPTEKARFKRSATVTGTAPIQENGVLQTFAVTALDSALLDLSRAQPRFEDTTYAHELLDKLDHLKTAILSNTISQQDLLDLNQLILSKKLATDDPQLKEILSEIETRVAVELAKLGL
ncbi:flagellar assembly protein FliX [Candidatus Paracaedibacter symbiosus]|uniref:flagellar assembly protein FliX n=1 Tax=Candidatus Paracaedibacter symbiosus TaxID=244582 RepID=UPI00068DAB00|nr:flagellar assembly protein FliX [Candidatus Paracaedibacter symbiosus]